MVRSIQGSWLPLALVASALVALAAWAAIIGIASAAGSVAAGSTTVEPGASGTVDVTASATDLGAWEIDVVYDPAVVTVDGCTEGAVGLNLCSVDLVADNTIRVVGASTSGSDGDVVLATIAFTAVGEDGDCTDLSVTVNQFADTESEELGPTSADGEICIETPTPTPEPTAAPTEAPTDTPAPSSLPDTGGTPDAGSSSNMAAYLLGILGLAVVGSGVFAVSRIRNQA